MSTRTSVKPCVWTLKLEARSESHVPEFLILVKLAPPMFDVTALCILCVIKVLLDMALHFSSERPEDQFYTDFNNLNKFGDEVRE